MQRNDESSNVVSFPGATKDYENAALWVARLDKGLDESGRRELVEWLEASPDNAAALFELAELWDELDLLAELSEIFPFDRRPARRRDKRIPVWSMAAVLALLAAGLLAFLNLSPAPGVPAPDSFVRSYATSVGELVTEQLPDGSQITMNTDTEISVAFRERERVVDMQRGEALFAVEKDPERPFLVRAGTHVVQAVGTAFTVRLQQNGGIDVTVTEGRVRVFESGAGRESLASLPEPDDEAGTALVKGQFAHIGRSEDSAAPVPEVYTLEPMDLDTRLSWQRGVLIFDAEPLDSVVAEFSRYTTMRFELEDPQLAEQRVSGYFSAGDTEGFLLSLSESFSIVSERIGEETIRLRPE